MASNSIERSKLPKKPVLNKKPVVSGDAAEDFDAEADLNEDPPAMREEKNPMQKKRKKLVY